MTHSWCDTGLVDEFQPCTPWINGSIPHLSYNNYDLSQVENKNNLCLVLFVSQLIKKPLCFSQSCNPCCVLEVFLTSWLLCLVSLAPLLPSCRFLHSITDRFSTGAVSDTWMLPSYQQKRGLFTCFVIIWEIVTQDRKKKLITAAAAWWWHCMNRGEGRAKPQPLALNSFPKECKTFVWVIFQVIFETQHIFWLTTRFLCCTN